MSRQPMPNMARPPVPVGDEFVADLRERHEGVNQRRAEERQHSECQIRRLHEIVSLIMPAGSTRPTVHRMGGVGKSILNGAGAAGGKPHPTAPGHPYSTTAKGLSGTARIRP